MLVDNSPIIDELVRRITQKLPDGGLIGLTGTGTSGKSTLAKQIAGHPGFSRYRLDALNHSEAYKEQLPNRPITGCHPDSFNAELATSVISALKNKQQTPIYKKTPTPYGFDQTGTFTPTKYTIVDGLACCLHGLIDFYDMLIFLTCSQEEEQRRRLGRDVPKFTKAEVRAKFIPRQTQFEQYILPFKERSDIVLYSNNNYSIEMAGIQA